MAYTLSDNLKLRVDSNLTANAKYNLARIDLLGATFLVDSTEEVVVRSLEGITLSPNDASLGGTGSGGTVTVDGVLDLADQAASGSKYLTLRYKSDASGSVDGTDRIFSLDMQGGDRILALAGDFVTAGGSITFTATGTTSLTLPLTGTLATLAGAETLTNKTIAAGSNTITGLTTSNLSASAGLVYSQFSLSNSIVNADINTAAAIDASKIAAGTVSNTEFGYLGSVTSDIQSQLDAKQASGSYITALSGDVVAAGPGSAATTIQNDAIIAAKIADGAVTNSKLAGSIARSKLLAGSATTVIVNDGAGNLSEASQLSSAMGGTGVNSTATFPSSGVILTDSNAATVTAKTMSGSANTFSNVPYSALVLTDSIVDADVDAAAAIAGSKIDPYFTDIVSGEGGFRAWGATYYTGIIAAPGQAADFDLTLPEDAGSNGQLLQTDGSGTLSWATVAGTGTVTSVALTAPSILSVAGSPITTTGTLAMTLATQNANKVWGGPATGADAEPTFRALVVADIPTGIDHGGLAGLADDDHTQYHTDARAATWLGTKSTTNLPEGSNLYFTDERVDDRVGALIQNGTGISWTYTDNGAASGTLTGNVSLAAFTTANLSENTNLYFTDERAKDAVGGILTDTLTVNLDYDDGLDSITATVLPGGVDHNSLLNFSANKHIDHTAVSISTAANSGLAGGGTIASTRTLIIDPSNVTAKTTPVAADTVLIGDSAASFAVKASTAQKIADLSGTSYATDWTSGTSKTVTHSLGSRDVIVQLYDNTTYETVEVDTVIRTDTNTVDLTSNEAPSGSGLRVLIRKL